MDKEKIIAKYGTDITQLNIANVRKWVRALRSGKYEQTIGALYELQTDDEGVPTNKATYCVLGVAAHLSGVSSEELDRYSVLPPKSMEWLGVESENPTIGDESATELNDDKELSFRRLATRIEKFWIKPYQKYKHCFLKQRKAEIK